MRHRMLVSAALALASTIGLPNAPARADAAQPAARTDDNRPDGDRRRFAGTYRFAGSAAEEAARSAAVDRAVGTLFFAIRGIARSRLSNGTKIDPWVSFGFEAGTIQFRTPSSPVATSPEQGAVVDYTSHGERSKLSQRFGDGRLVQVFAADEGKRVNEWALAPDGSTLLVRVTISSPKLSAPVVYSLTYRKT
ncbi:MAG: hypothetical protein QOI41_81 [Myxococcales bacterium]|nr:hypothetical protein [Myxococcales bacterium]